eukprot:TRINITY_DN273_c0_g1_i3.p1 TRINITY_DN273_c0_g1~~TRINITY_DN273_c0_g1_i3.p1  ORF type:complete len:611 (-),score=43.07 TRINITY_DN273_c0_g1_i3:114-1946(-)
MRKYDKVLSGSLEDGSIAWFENGVLNVSYNCIDRHLEQKADQPAIIWESDDPNQAQSISFKELYRRVNQFANALKECGVQRGDRVAIYMPMVPEAAYAMLACARIGAIHSVVFAGFSAEAFRDRVNDCKAKVVVTSNYGMRGGKAVPLKRLVDEALDHCPSVSNVLVHKRTEDPTRMKEGRDIWLHEILPLQRPYCPPQAMNSEDPLFLLYTSGSTGKPKGLVHTTGGYLTYAAATHKYVFDYKPGDVYACVADVGWITGHSYIVYGPLANGATTLMFESVPTYPNASRYWDLVQKHKVTQFYTSPTALRTLIKYGLEPLKGYNLTSLRVIGSVGEPINPEVWKWYYENVGLSKASVVDTYWQTETGGIIISSLPGATPMKPGSATLPMFGIKLALLQSETGAILPERPGVEESGVLAISQPWPGLARTIYRDHGRYLQTYMDVYKGFYFTGDGARRDKDGYYWITGRVDDVINKAGHRLGTAEIESALVSHESCSEAAVVAVPTNSAKGEAIVAFCTLKNGYIEDPDVIHGLKETVKRAIGKIADPDAIVVTHALPKTRSGKIMRRLLRKVAEGVTDPKALGDISTLAEPHLVEELIDKVKQVKSRVQF